MSEQGSTARLATPGYWDGIDIHDPTPFDVERVPPEHLSAPEQAGAGIVLASCLDEVMSNDYMVSDLKTGSEFNPTESELSDGTVFVMDLESIAQFRYGRKFDRDWQEPAPDDPGFPDDPLIEIDAVAMWRSQQPHMPMHGHFGSVRAAFTEDKMTYVRALEWGVLITRCNEDRDRLVATWPLAAPTATGAGVQVPTSGPRECKLLRTAQRVPMKIGQAVPQADRHTPRYSVRSMKRLRSLKILRAATAVYEPQESETEASDEPGLTPGRLFAPEPIPSTA